MSFPRRCLLPYLLLPLAFVAVGASIADRQQQAEERRGYGAHVHGVGRVNLVLEGGDIHLELVSPAAGIVGFEHAPRSEADHAALDRAVAALKSGDRLFQFNSGAGCRMENVSITSSLREAERGTHKREERADSARKAHAHESENHADIEAAYHFDCANPAGLDQLTVELFATFPGTERLIVQFVLGDRQGLAELTPTNPVLKF